MKRKTFLTLMVLPILVFLSPKSAHPDMWGGDIPLLLEIVQNTLSELSALRTIVQTGSDDFSYLQQINSGINDSLQMIRTVFPNANPGVYGSWQNAGLAMQGLVGIYGAIAPSRDAPVQQNTDQSVAEAIALNNSIYNYSDQIDELGEQIKFQSHTVSPGGAAKLTAQSLGVMLNLLNESLRTQATGLKLQAEELALLNRHDKESDRYVMETSQALQDSMQDQETDFQFPNF